MNDCAEDYIKSQALGCRLDVQAWREVGRIIQKGFSYRYHCCPMKSSGGLNLREDSK
jgi:hypothetical protein